MEDSDGQGQEEDDISLQYEWPGRMLSSKHRLMGGSAVALGDPTGGRFKNCLAFYLEASVQLRTAEPLLNL